MSHRPARWAWLAPAWFSRARALTFSDSRTGSLGRFVWTDERGDQVFGELAVGAVATGRHVEGAITGGTGRYAGLSGKLEFEWQYVLETEDGLVQGRAVGLKGRVGRTGGTRREEGGALPPLDRNLLARAAPHSKRRPTITGRYSPLARRGPLALWNSGPKM
jgi:hypothetical protein